MLGLLLLLVGQVIAPISGLQASADAVSPVTLFWAVPALASDGATALAFSVHCPGDPPLQAGVVATVGGPQVSLTCGGKVLLVAAVVGPSSPYGADLVLNP